MVFSSLLFVFAFLAICYGLYMIVPGIKARNMILLLFSLVFYAWGGPSFLVLLLLMTLVCYLGGLLIGRYQSRRKLWLVMTLVVCLGLLGYYKYTGFFLTNIQAIFGVPEVIPTITLPIGISFYTFQLLSYVIDVYRKEVPAQKNYLTLLLYAALFHQCIAGPIIRYSDVNEEIMERRIVRSDVAKGITRFASGLAKKALLANGCAAIVADLVEAPADFAGTPVEYLSTVSGAGILLAALCYMLEIYLDFSAYSDMAIGMGLMIGFHYRENFNYPYIADSVTDFWRRWHISLSSFFRDYVYIPPGRQPRGGLAQHPQPVCGVVPHGTLARHQLELRFVGTLLLPLPHLREVRSAAVEELPRPCPRSAYGGHPHHRVLRLDDLLLHRPLHAGYRHRGHLLRQRKSLRGYGRQDEIPWQYLLPDRGDPGLHPHRPRHRPIL